MQEAVIGSVWLLRQRDWVSCVSVAEEKTVDCGGDCDLTGQKVRYQRSLSQSKWQRGLIEAVSCGDKRADPESQNRAEWALIKAIVASAAGPMTSRPAVSYREPC